MAIPKAKRSSRSGSSSRRKVAIARQTSARRGESTVQLRAAGSTIEWSVSPALAMRWSHAVLNRRRWASDDAASRRQSDHATAALEGKLGDWISKLDARAFDGLFEVAIRHDSESQSWPARLLPWEYLLATTRKDRSPPTTVVRSLELARPTKAPAASNGLMLYVESAPGVLRERYSFESERSLVRHALGIAEGEAHDARTVRPKLAAKLRMLILEDPDREELESVVRRFGPEIIHITGFDTHQGFALLGRDGADDGDGEDGYHDGYLLRGPGGPTAVLAQDLARVVCAAEEKPRLVSFNLFNSGARIAPLTAAEGAEVVVGFLTDFNDSLTERLFADLYTAWRHQSRPAVAAFRWAFDQQRLFPSALRGTSVVCYVQPSSVDLGAKLDKDLSSLRASIESARKTRVTLGDEPSLEFDCRIKPCAMINYSLLHNALPLFEAFDLIKHHDGTLPNVSVEVSLHLGPDSAPYRRTLDLVDRVTPLAREVAVPLTSALARSVRESVRTSLYVRVEAEGRRLFERTYPVSLLSANEWRDTDEDRIWLPSFVLPRDPVVARIIDSAQRYLMALADDPAAGFDGYQSGEAESVDAQVRAIWNAILYDHPLSYINPPPSYALSSQRIRTPSEVVVGRRGTCIDLALLLAACLEYVDIYPTVFLLEGHCFVGYWRSENGHESFELAQGSEPVALGFVDDRSKDARRRGRLQYGWYFDRTYFAEVKQWVAKRELVPLEAVCLTGRQSFAQSQVQGLEDLRSKSEFDSMLDIERARRASVTPLPIAEESS